MDTIEITDVPWEAQIRLNPLGWLDGLTGGDDDDDELRVTPASGAAYRHLLDNVRASVVLMPASATP